MGYVVLHFNKAKGNEARMTKHIERSVDPPNADKSRTHLNRELIEFPSGVTNRTQAIQHRIKTAGIFRKITSDQVKVIRVNVSGSHEDMMRIVNEGRINEWCRDNVDYFKREFGEKNIVSAVLHMDEKTPHIHIALVPIVTGKRRKAKEGSLEKETIRLCADDILTKTKMKGYQDSYALAMAKYGLKRGIEGSKAKHRTTAQYYRDTLEKGQAMEEKIGRLEQQEQKGIQTVKLVQEKETAEQQRLAALQAENDKKQMEIEEKQKQLRQVKNEIIKVGFEKTAKETGKEFLEGVGRLMGNHKAKKLETENINLKQKVEVLEQEKEDILNNAQKDIAQKDRAILEKDSTIAVQKNKMNRWVGYFPVLNEYDFIMRICEAIRLPENIIDKLFADKTLSYTGKLYSPEHKHHFDAENLKVSIAKNTKDNKPFLTLGEMYYVNWFRDQKQKFYQSLGLKINEPKRQRGQTR